MPKHLNAKAQITNTKERNKSLHIARVCSVFIAIVVAFCLGFVLRGSSTVMSLVGMDQHASATNGQAAPSADKSYDSISARVAEVESLLSSESLNSYDLSTLTSTVIGSFASSVNDPYLTYFDETRYRNYVSEAASNSYAGIGVLFSEYNGNVYAIDVFENGPAAAAGVMQNDIVVGIDGNNVESWTATEVANTLSREEGSETVITWRRSAGVDSQGGEEFTTTIVCSSTHETNVSSELSGEVGYISIKQFTMNSADLVADTIADLESNGAKAFVLDLRDCPGGYLSQAVDIASLFMTSGVVVQIQTASELTTRSASGTPVTQAPLVVLINNSTSAAAEVLAAALQDSSRAKLIGVTSLGKGSVQVVRELSFGGALRYTAARYISPLGHELDGSGVTPDIHISNSDETDSQKDLAIETAESLVQS